MTLHIHIFLRLLFGLPLVELADVKPMDMEGQLSLPTRNKCDPPSFLAYLLDSLAPAVLFLSMLCVHTKTITQMFIAALFVIARKQKNSNVNKSMNKQIVVYSYNQIPTGNAKGKTTYTCKYMSKSQNN